MVAAHLQPAVDKIFARTMALARNSQVMPGVVFTDLAAELAQFGDEIDTETPYPMGTQAVAEGGAAQPPEPIDRPIKMRKLLLDTHEHSEIFSISDRQMTQIDSNRFYVPSNSSSAVDAIAEKMNASLWDRYKEGYAFFGSSGLTAFEHTTYGVNWATQAYAALRNQKMPTGVEAQIVLDPIATANAKGLPGFQADTTGDPTSILRTNRIGTFSGLNFYEDQQAPVHAAGSAVDDGTIGGTPYANNIETSVLNETLVDQGAVDNDVQDTQVIQLNLDAPDTQTLNEGDIIIFANHSQPYVVRDSPDVSINPGNSNVTIAPPLRVPVDGSGTPVAVTAIRSHRVGLAFARPAIAFANRMLRGDSSPVWIRTSQQDGNSGVMMRLQTTDQWQRQIWVWDALWGTQARRPEWICRIVHDGGSFDPNLTP